MSFKTLLTNHRTIIDTQLQTTLPQHFQRYETTTPWTQSLMDYVLGGGKRLRPILAMMYAKELGGEIDTHIDVFNALEVFHDFILAHDDIVDQDDLRWGNPTIHTRLQTAYPNLTIHDRQHFGQALAMIGGDVLHAMAQYYIFDANISDTTKILLLKTMNEAMLDVARGRYKQFLSDSMPIQDVSLDYILDYNLWQVTGCYSFLFPLRFAHVLTRGDMQIDPRIHELCRYFGVLFQTGDDMIGLFGDPTHSGKSNDGDIIQGKKTIPLYFAYQNASETEKAELDTLIGNKNLDQSQAARCKEIISLYGVAPTKVFMQEYAHKAQELIEQMDWSEEYRYWWREFLEYLMMREG